MKTAPYLLQPFSSNIEQCFDSFDCSVDNILFKNLSGVVVHEVCISSRTDPILSVSLSILCMCSLLPYFQASKHPRNGASRVRRNVTPDPKPIMNQIHSWVHRIQALLKHLKSVIYRISKD